MFFGYLKVFLTNGTESISILNPREGSFDQLQGVEMFQIASKSLRNLPADGRCESRTYLKHDNKYLFRHKQV